MSVQREQAILVGEIMALVHLVNSFTEYCVFTNYYGHTDSFEVKITASRSKYLDTITSDDLYLCNGESYSQRGEEQTTKRLKRARTQLRKILRDGGVKYSELSYTIREERDYNLAIEPRKERDY